MSGYVHLAVASLAIALVCLRTGPRQAVLTAGSTAGHRPGWVMAHPVLRRWRFGLVMGVCGGLLVGSVVPGVVAAVLVGVAAMWLVEWLATEPDRKRQRALVAQLPECLELLSAALTAGLPLRTAVRQVADLVCEPTAGLLRGVLGHLDIGRNDAEAWSTLRSHPVWGPMARDLARCAESGAAVARALEVHAVDARARRDAARQQRARTVGCVRCCPWCAATCPPSCWSGWCRSWPPRSPQCSIVELGRLRSG